MEEARTNVIGVVVLAALRDPAVRQVVEEQLVEFSRQLRASRADDSLTGVTAVALLTAWVGVQYAPELPLAAVTSRVQEDQPYKIGGKRISRLIEKTLGRGLHIERKGGTSKVKGITRARMERLALIYQVDLPGLAQERNLPWPPPRSPMRRA